MNMKMKFKFKYYRLQDQLIDRIKDSGIPCRIKKDKTIEYARKHKDEIDDLICDIRFSLFERPASRIWNDDIDKKHLVDKFVESNIPYFEEDHDGVTWFLYNYCDSEIIGDIEREIGVLNHILAEQIN